MDKLNRYREILRNLIQQYAEFKPANGQIETEAVMDMSRDHYEVIHVGWDGVRRVHGSVVHLDILDGKVWIQHDGTSRCVAEELEAAGIPREDIVLGFHPASVRELSGYGIGAA
jgi:hypothetical protein